MPMGYFGLGVIAALLPLLVFKRDLLMRNLLGREGSKQRTTTNAPGQSRDHDHGADRIKKPVIEKHGLSSRSDVDVTDGKADTASPDTTPKARTSTTDRDPIPSFTLDEGEGDKIEEPSVSNTRKQALGKNTAYIPEQKQQTPKPLMPPPARPNPNSKRKPETSPQTLMPPPSRPPPATSNPRSPSKPSTTLRPPPSVASTLRAPPSRSLAPQTSSLAPSTSTLSPSSRPSKKVLLSPGHSPLDWAYLIKSPPTTSFLRGSSVPPHLIHVPPSLLKYHNGRKGKDAWGVWQGKVYNLTPYMEFHPGGESELMKGAGRERDAERLFLEVHPWVNWEGMLGECLVGVLVGEDELGRESEGGLEEMD